MWTAQSVILSRSDPLHARGPAHSFRISVIGILKCVNINTVKHPRFAYCKP